MSAAAVETVTDNLEASDGNPTLIWRHCKVDGGKFEAYGGAHSRTTLISIFREWAERTQPSAT